MLALILGLLITIIALAFVLQPLFVRRSRALRARATRRTTTPTDAELEAMIVSYRSVRRECPVCGLRPEANATFCSECGRELVPRDASALDRVEPPQGDADGN